MKKYDELFKRVEMFEKLAVYGNRSQFLQSIAQDMPRPGQLTVTPTTPPGTDPFNLFKGSPAIKEFDKQIQSRKPKADPLSTQTGPAASMAPATVPVPPEVVTKIKSYQKLWDNWENYITDESGYQAAFDKVNSLLNSAAGSSSLSQAEQTLESALNEMAPVFDKWRKSETKTPIRAAGINLLNEIKAAKQKAEQVKAPYTSMVGPEGEKSSTTTAPVTTSPAAKVKPKYWGTKEQMALIKDIQQFLEMSLGKDVLAPYGVDGKWGTTSKKALSQWLRSGDGSLNPEAIRQLARYIPSVKDYYNTLPESKKPDPYNPESLVTEPTNAVPTGRYNPGLGF